MRRFNHPLILVMAGVFLALAGCGDDPVQPPPDPVLPATSELNVLHNLSEAWRLKRIDIYSEMLADDYQFYFDQATRDQKGLPVFWTRLDDSTNVQLLFSSIYTRTITIRLDGITDPVTVPEIGRETWTKVDVRNTFLEVVLDPSPAHPDGPTLRVNGSLQHFFFRKGRNAADTTEASPTAKLYYIVEWDDMGAPAS
jgi:hypothetical protein